MKRNISKKIVSTFAVAALLLSAAACSGNPGKKDKTSEAETAESSEESVYSNPESSVWYPSGHEPSKETLSSSESSETETSKSGGVPSEWQDGGIFSSYYSKAFERVKNMNIETKIGQMLFVGCPSQNAAELAYDHHIGGYVLFANDFKGKTKQQVINDVSTYVYAGDIPLCIAVDEEGGTVNRVSTNPYLSDYPFQSPRSLYSSGGMIAIQSDAQVKAELLKSLYISVNLAPVCDISTYAGDFMYSRSLGQDAATTSDFVRTVTEISQANGVSVTLKHFPGYGNNLDTHNGSSVDKRDLTTLQNNDFLPFKEGIEAGAHCVLVAHNIVNCIDSENPASLSPAVHNVLRSDLGFTGIIMTDDLTMSGAAATDKKIYVSAVLAGNDMLMINPSNLEAVISEIKTAVEDETIDVNIIDRAVMRVLAWKYQKGLLTN